MKRSDLVMRPSPATPETPWALQIRTEDPFGSVATEYYMVVRLTEEASDKLIRAGLIATIFGAPETQP